MDNKIMFTREHEWARKEGETVFIGISDFAQRSLGDIVFVELPEPGSEYSAGDAFAVVESVKAASDVYMPVSGMVVRVNEMLEDDPGKINSDPYGSWMVEIQPGDLKEMDALMDEDQYRKFCEEE